jgi:DNA replication and repair protein RecF
VSRVGEPLRIEHLFLRGFRNLAPLELFPGPRFNVLSGDNGQGKSNTLEAIAYLASLSSFRSAPSEELVQRDADFALLAAKVHGHVVDRTLKVRLYPKGRARELALDDKRPRTSAAWRAVCPVVVFHPRDLELAHGGPDARRALLDAIASEMDPAYEAALADYTRALRSRNRLLKAERPDRASIVAFDPILVERGALLIAARRFAIRLECWQMSLRRR